MAMRSPLSAFESGTVAPGAVKRSAVEVHGLQLLGLAFSTLGIIYSDIGTSPLYVLNAIWPPSGDVPSREDVIGGVSAIIWSLTLLPLLKYVFVSLYFGTREGEGGTFALYQGIYPAEDKDFDGDRTLTGDTMHAHPARPASLKRSFKWPLLVWCLCGTSLTMADGVFTPAVSVTSAVGGIAVAKESVKDAIIPISIAFLVLLFMLQQFGTARISILFSPIALVWFLLLAGTGIANIVHYPGIFRAFDPSRAVLLFVRTRNYDLLNGILLAFTGSEAIFANLGQFNKTSIRLSFCCLVYPALLLAYLGQGARLIVDGAGVLDNVFYETIPGARNGPLFWIVFVFAILATIIASQAMITATFSLFQQVINLKSFPPLRLKYTSDTVQGQVYVPAVNWTLFIVVIAVVGGFSDLSAMTNAYGFAVATVCLSTALLIAVHIHVVKRLPIILSIAFFIFFGFFDALFFGAAVKKVPHGAWVPLMIGAILTAIMVHWTWAKGLEDEFDGANRVNLRHFIFHGATGAREPDGESVHESDAESLAAAPLYYLKSTPSNDSAAEKTETDVAQTLTRIPTCAMFHKFTPGAGVPHTFVGFIRQYPALPRVVIFLSVCVLPVARISLEARYVVQKTRSVDGFYSATYYLGFREKFDVQLDELLDRICALERQADPDQSARVIEEIRLAARTSTHITPSYYVVSKRVDAGRLSPAINWFRRVLVEDLYRRLATMFPETTAWLTPADEIIHVGVNAVI